MAVVVVLEAAVVAEFGVVADLVIAELAVFEARSHKFAALQVHIRNVPEGAFAIEELLDE